MDTFRKLKFKLKLKFIFYKNVEGTYTYEM